MTPPIPDAPRSPVGSIPQPKPDRWTVWGIGIFLAAVIWVVFGQTWHHQFINFDDPAYVVANPIVQQGLTWEGFRWALTYGEIGHWHPLTWLSHMLDCQLYGLNPGSHHGTNVLLHTATTILLFLVLRQMTGFLWRSAFVAAVFAIHPLRVESVAWIAERKDVLSACFFMLTLGAYVRYVRRPPSMLGYGLVMSSYALGLLSKNMLVTTPFVLLLLDYWPLQRISTFTPKVLLRLVAEKIPLFGLTILSCLATALVPEKVPVADQLSFVLRMENVLTSYVTYIWQMLYPSGLACLYPNPVNDLPLGRVIGALGLLLVVSGAAWKFRQSHPSLIVGWLWYLGMLIPAIGMVQISYYAHADRYTYLPEIGLYLALTWMVADVCTRWRHRSLMLGGCAAVILVALTFCAHTQAAYWKDSETLWSHTLACTSDNAIAELNHGNALVQNGNVNAALVDFQTALQLKPRYAEAHFNLGDALAQKGRMDEAIAQFQQAVQLKPDYAEAHNNLANALILKGRVDEALSHFRQALQLEPDRAEAHYNLASALIQSGQVEEAIRQFQASLRIKPDRAETHYNLGLALIQKGSVDAAIRQFQQSLQIQPGRAEGHVNLANALLQKGKVDEAITHYQAALQIKPDDAPTHYNLGNVLVRKGMVDAAIREFQKALQINPDYANAHYNLGYALLQQGESDEAIRQFQMVLQLKPGDAPTHYNLGTALIQKGDVAAAMDHFQMALQIKPNYPEALNDLAWELATSAQPSARNGNQSVALAQRANQLTGGTDLDIVGTLAAAYAEAGQFDEAIVTVQKSIELARTTGRQDQLSQLNDELKLYAARMPFHQDNK